MTEEMNGKSVPQDIPPTPQNVANFIGAFIGPAVNCTLNGCIRSFAHLPLEAVIVMFCALAGRAVGQVLSIGELVPVMGLRKRCADAFIGEMRAIKITPAGQPTAQVGAVPPETKELLRKLKP